MLFATGIMAQDSNKASYLQSSLRENAIEQQKWESAIQDLDYSGKPLSKNKDKKAKENRRDYDSWDRSSGGSSAGALGGSMAKILLISTIAVLVLVLLYNMSGVQLNFGGNRKINNPGTINLREVEENLLESELDKLTRQAIESGNYALAIRLYFLQSIKDLSIKKAIRWKKDKTNRDYLREMKAHPLASNFRELSLVFDRVWYGQKPIDKAHFEVLQPQFQRFLKAIQKS